MLKFSVNADFSGIKRQLQNTASRAESIVATQVMKDTDKYVPMQSGNLKKSSHLEGHTIVYPGPYARFLYYGKVMIYEPTGSTWAPKYEHKVVTGRDLEISHAYNINATSHWFEVSKAMNQEKWERVAQKAIEYCNRS